MTLFHLSLAVRGRRVLAPDEAARREVVRVVARAGRRRLLQFSAVDDHLHALLKSTRPRYLARDLGRALRRMRPDLVLKPPHLEPVESRAHLMSLVRYLLQQPSHHGLPGPQALWAGSCFVDLVGARLLPGFEWGALYEELPRLRQRELFEHVGLSAEQLVGPDGDTLRDLGAARLTDLAASVFAVGPQLVGRSRPVVLARALTARVGLRAGIPSRELSRCLGVTPGRVRRLATIELPARSPSALGKRWALEERVRREGAGPAPPAKGRSVGRG